MTPVKAGTFVWYKATGGDVGLAITVDHPKSSKAITFGTVGTTVGLNWIILPNPLNTWVYRDRHPHCDYITGWDRCEPVEELAKNS